MAIPEGALSLSQAFDLYYHFKFKEPAERRRSRDHRPNTDRLADWWKGVQPLGAQREDQIADELIAALRLGYPDGSVANHPLGLVAKYIDSGLNKVVKVPTEPWIVDSFAAMRLDGFAVNVDRSSREADDPWNHYQGRFLFVDAVAFDTWMKAPRPKRPARPRREIVPYEQQAVDDYLREIVQRGEYGHRLWTGTTAPKKFPGISSTQALNAIKTVRPVIAKGRPKKGS